MELKLKPVMGDDASNNAIETYNGKSMESKTKEDSINTVADRFNGDWIAGGRQRRCWALRTVATGGGYKMSMPGYLGITWVFIVI